MKLLRLSMYVFLCIAFIAIASNTFAQKISIKSTPDWVRPEPLPQLNLVENKYIDNGYYFLLIDEQEHIDKAVSFNHYAMHIVNDAGVGMASEQTIVFFPEYQKLHFHFLRIIRNGKVIDQLKSENIQFLQRETDLEYKMLDGGITAYITLKDVRKKDVLEYAYSIEGRNPIFDGKFYGFRKLSFGQPVASEKLKYIWNANRKIDYELVGDNISKPILSNDKQGNKVLMVESQQTKPEELEDEIPYNYPPTYSYITLTEFENWGEVAEWALNLYPNPNPSAEVKDKVKEIVAGINNKEKQVLATIRFVQDEIRYLGVETGESSHRPAAPTKTLQCGFGDCKGKTELLRAMLHVLGVQSYPMLVNTDFRAGVKHLKPGPQVFNHVVLSFYVNNHQYFVDPTMSYQRGNLKNLQFPNYGSGLIIKPDQVGLTDTYIDNRINKKNVFEYFELGVVDSAAKLYVTTHYLGEQADQLRYELASNSQSDIQKNYVEFYEKIYGKTKLASDIEILDDEEENILTIREYYIIEQPWTAKTDKTGYNFSALAQTLTGMISAPKPGERKHPLGLNYPLEITQQIALKFPVNWDFKPESKRIQNPAFLYTYDAGYETLDSGKFFVINCSYLAGNDHVEASAYEQYVKDIDEINNANGYSIDWNGNTDTSSQNNLTWTTNWQLLSFSIAIFLLCLLAAGRIYYRFDPIPKEGVIGESIPIGGWLILVAFGQIASFFIQIYNLWDGEYFNQTNLDLLNNPQHPNYHAMWEFFIYAELLLCIPLLVLTGLNLILLKNRRSSFPAMFVSTLGLAFIINCFQVYMVDELGLAEGSDEIFVNFFKTLLACVIWIPYMLRSTRVKETFTVMLNPPHNPLPGEIYRKPLYTYNEDKNSEGNETPMT